jgi:dihydrofolate synthase/folylpolyglutamate synthase
MLPQGWELWLDGAHNDSGGEVLGMQAARWRDRPLDLIFGVRAEKVPADVLRPLAHHAQRLRAIAIPGDPVSLPADQAAAAAKAAGFADAEPAGSVDEALRGLIQPGPPRRILICGSLYLAGAVLAENG